MKHDTRKILIIEDDQIIAKIYKSRFEKAGYEVEIACDGQAGFYRIHETKPNAVLLDLMLPQMNGLEILKKIRAQKRFEKLPILVFTNAYLSEFAYEAAAVGASRVFNKATTSPQQILDVANALLFLPQDAGNDAGRQISPALSVSGGMPPGPCPGAGAPAPDAQPPANVITMASPTATSGSGTSRESDALFQVEFRKIFEAAATETIGTLRKMLKGLSESQNKNARLNQLLEFYRKVHIITGSSAILESLPISQLSSALEALLKELYDRPAGLTASTLWTIGEAIDFLSTLFKEEKCSGPDPTNETQTLVVDDEAIWRRAATYALQKANLKSVGVDDSEMAYILLAGNKFDLIILDVEMPGMNGFELCRKLRKLPGYEETPVIFVSSPVDLEAHGESRASKADDIIAKPFLFMELCLKALIHMLRHHSVRPSAERSKSPVA